MHGRADLYSSRELHDLRLLEAIILALLLKFDLARFDIQSKGGFRNLQKRTSFLQSHEIGGRKKPHGIRDIDSYDVALPAVADDDSILVNGLGFDLVGEINPPRSKPIHRCRIEEVG